MIAARPTETSRWEIEALPPEANGGLESRGAVRGVALDRRVEKHAVMCGGIFFPLQPPRPFPALISSRASPPRRKGFASPRKPRALDGLRAVARSSP
jgi:hypothetical protein